MGEDGAGGAGVSALRWAGRRCWDSDPVATPRVLSRSLDSAAELVAPPLAVGVAVAVAVVAGGKLGGVGASGTADIMAGISSSNMGTIYLPAPARGGG